MITLLFGRILLFGIGVTLCAGFLSRPKGKPSTSQQPQDDPDGMGAVPDPDTMMC